MFRNFVQLCSSDAYIRYRHTLNWLCLGRLVVTSLRNYLQMHLMFLSNDSLLFLLDLILSTEPSTIINVTTVPGISDHEGVFFQLKTCVEKCTVTSRKIYQFHKANSSVIKREVLEISQIFFSENPYQRSVEENWTIFRRPFMSKAHENYCKHLFDDSYYGKSKTKRKIFLVLYHLMLMGHV